MTPAAAIGTEATRILYAGPRDIYETHHDLLDAFGGTAHYLGEDVAAAATYDVALLSLFWTSIAGLTQALALTRAEGLDATEFAPHAVAMSQLVVDLLPGSCRLRRRPLLRFRQRQHRLPRRRLDPSAISVRPLRGHHRRPRCGQFGRR